MPVGLKTYILIIRFHQSITKKKWLSKWNKKWKDQQTIDNLVQSFKTTCDYKTPTKPSKRKLNLKAVYDHVQQIMIIN